MPNADIYGLLASGLPPDIAAKAQGLTTEQMIAQALMAQSQQPLGMRDTGMFKVPSHPLEGLAQMAQQYVAQDNMKGQQSAIEALLKQKQQGEAQAMQRYMQMSQGTPAVPGRPAMQDPQEVEQQADQGTQPPPNIGGQAAVPGDRRAAVAAAMMNPYMKNNPLVMADMRNQEAMDLERLKASLPKKPGVHVVGHDLVGEDGKVIYKGSESQKPMIEHNFSVAENMVQPHISLDNGKTWAPVPGSVPSMKFAKQLPNVTNVRNEPAPTMSEVLDPKDPTRMLKVNAREYKGGTLGDPGVLGVAGKEPTAAKREEQVGTGRETVSTVVSSLRDSYDKLSASGGITDPSKGTLSNIGAAIGSSGIGQIAGRAVGTENQSLRNTIAQTRPLLMNAIKQATGMSAKQMDSNVELKLWLATATDPTLDIKANMNALDNIEKLYGLGAAQGKPQRRAMDKPGAVIDFNSLPR